MKEFDWSYRLYLDRKIYLPIIKLQAKKGLTKSKAGLLCIVEGLNRLGYLSDEDYEIYKSKYSIGIEELANAPTPAQIREQEKLHNKNRQLNRYFSEVNKQWSHLKDLAKRYHIKKADQHKNLKMAKYVLDLAKQEGLI